MALSGRISTTDRLGSLAVLEAEQKLAMVLVRPTDIPVDSGINIMKSVVELYVVQRQEFDAALQNLSIQLPPHVDVVMVEGLAQPALGDRNTIVIALPFVCSN